MLPVIDQKTWNKRQRVCRKLLLKGGNQVEAVRQILRQHAVLHSSALGEDTWWSYEDELFDGLSEEQLRLIPDNHEHSIAWLIWHLARIEDVTMNILVADTGQVFTRVNWLDRLKNTTQDTGNAMIQADLIKLSATIDLD